MSDPRGVIEHFEKRDESTRSDRILCVDRARRKWVTPDQSVVNLLFQTTCFCTWQTPLILLLRLYCSCFLTHKLFHSVSLMLRTSPPKYDVKSTSALCRHHCKTKYKWSSVSTIVLSKMEHNRYQEKATDVKVRRCTYAHVDVDWWETSGDTVFWRVQYDCNATTEFDVNVEVDRKMMTKFYTRATEHMTYWAKHVQNMFMGLAKHIFKIGRCAELYPQVSKSSNDIFRSKMTLQRRVLRSSSHTAVVTRFEEVWMDPFYVLWTPTHWFNLFVLSSLFRYFWRYSAFHLHVVPSST